MRSLKVIQSTITVTSLIIISMWHSASVQAQGLTASDVVKSWDIATKMVVESAKAMPAEHYSFTPGEPLRNFADQLNHTTRSSIGFASSFDAGKPDFKFNKNKPPQGREEVIALLEKSFAHLRSGLEKLSDEDLSKTVPWGPPSNKRQITKLKAYTFVLNHVHSEHGKTIMYLRAKGIAPAPSGDWSFD